MIKRYCQNVNIQDILFIEKCCFNYPNGKWGRRDVQRFLSDFSGISTNEIRLLVSGGNKHELYGVVSEIAAYMISCIQNRELHLQPINYHTIIDGMTKKERIIGVQHPLHQMFDYVAVEGMAPMLKAKIGVFQCASLPGKGQSFGKKHVERWVREEKTTYFAKGDIKKCFPSISSKRIKELIRRDVKNEELSWLVCDLVDRFGSGLSIGSYLSQYLCNYYLSYAYHFASEKLFKIRKTRNNGPVRIRLINHVLFYMDDFLLTGSSKKDLRKAMRMLIRYISDFLELDVKPNWKVNKISETEPIDMMGFVFRKNRTTIRTKIFLKTRRYFLKARKRMLQKRIFTLDLARKCISAYGWYMHTDSWEIRKKLQMEEVLVVCKKVVSYYSKLERSKSDASIA